MQDLYRTAHLTLEAEGNPRRVEVLFRHQHWEPLRWACCFRSLLGYRGVSLSCFFFFSDGLIERQQDDDVGVVRGKGLAPFKLTYFPKS